MNKYLLFLAVFLPIMVSAGNEVDSLLKVLDARIVNSQVYCDKKESTINYYRRKLQSTSADTARYPIYASLYHEYRSYKYDSAYSYAGRMLRLAEKTKDPNLIVTSRVALGFSCLSAGLYKEAVEIAYSVDTNLVKKEPLAAYYKFLSTLYLSMSDFAASGPYYRSYRDSSLKYSRQQISLLKPESDEYILANMLKSQLEDNYFDAVRYANIYLGREQVDRHDRAIALSMLAFFNEVQIDTLSAMANFARAAILDIETAVKETAAIRQLAELLYLKGDISHAYLYAMTALEDANYYNARQRKIEVGRTLPIIEAGRFAIIEEQKNKLLRYAVAISVLSILFMIAGAIIFIQKRRLSSARKIILDKNADLTETNRQLITVEEEISRQNKELLLFNEKLKEVHRIKDEYIGYFFSMNSSYIEKMSEYRKLIARKIKSGQIDDLLQQTGSNELRREKEDMFAMFDTIFMKLFPDFIDRYNQLFKEADRVYLKEGEMLTPEVRIFALIRLGITESERIARFLDYSLSTVKNYKTKVKNRSVIPNELFEQKIMEIESVKTEFSADQV